MATKLPDIIYGGDEFDPSAHQLVTEAEQHVRECLSDMVCGNEIQILPPSRHTDIDTGHFILTRGLPIAITRSLN